MKNYLFWILTGSVLTLLISYFVYIFPLFVKEEHHQEIDSRIAEIYNTITSWTQITLFSGKLDKEFIMPVLQDIYLVQSDNTQYFLWIVQDVWEPEIVPHIFIASKQGSWKPWLSIKDALKDSCHWGNRPMAFTTENGKLLLTVLDKCGGWSMEGYVSVLELQADWTRKTIRCYNYDNWSLFRYETPEEERQDWKRYPRGTTQFDKLEPVPFETCKDNIEILYLL